MNITFIGLGIMGSRMASNLLKNNVKLTVYNRSPKKAEALKQKGATIAENIKEAVKDADIVFSMLSKPEVVKSMFFGQNKTLSFMQKNALWIDCSTVNPSFTLEAKQESEKFGIRYLEAPVAGSKPQAQQAELAFFVGGEAQTLQEAEPLLKMMGQKILHLGEVSKGASFKMLVNAMLAQSMLIFSEAVLLGEKMGLDKEFLLNTLPNLVVSAPFTKAKAEMIRQDNYEVQFPLELMHKDLHLACLTAYEENQPLYLANLVKEVFADAQKQGLGRLDFSAIHQFLERK